MSYVGAGRCGERMTMVPISAAASFLGVIDDNNMLHAQYRLDNIPHINILIYLH